jgi:hypothetical protein
MPLMVLSLLAAPTGVWVDAASKNAMSVAPTDAAPILIADLCLLRLDCENCCTCFAMTTSKMRRL